MWNPDWWLKIKWFLKQFSISSNITSDRRDWERALLSILQEVYVKDYPGCQRLFMRGFRFRLSLKKWPARKVSGPDRHPFDSAEPNTTLIISKHPESGCFAYWFLGDIECFKRSDWITITTDAWSGRGWFEGDKDQIQTIQAHITDVWNWKYQIPVCNEDLDKVIAEVTGTFDGVEEIRAELREGIVNYKFQLLPGIWVGRKHTTFTSCEKAACSMECFLLRVDYDWANVNYFCHLFHTERSQHALIFWGLFLVGMIRPLMRVENISFLCPLLKRKLLPYG